MEEKSAISSENGVFSHAEDVRTEYSSLIAYHNDIVTHRFSLLGIFVLAVGLFVRESMGLKESALLLAITIGIYFAERRNRFLFTQMSKRAMEIERLHWNLNRRDSQDLSLPLFSRFRINELPEEIKKSLPESLKDEMNKTKNRSLKRITSSHSRGLDLVYGSIALYAIFSIVQALLR